ncbi:MAG: RICIN domain-containing protein [Verrucomicrobiota bacterium]
MDSDSSHFADFADPANNGERGIDVGAFRRNDGQIVLVVVNDSNSNRFMNLSGLTGSCADVYEVSPSKSASVVSSLSVNGGGESSYVFPKKSVNIIVCKNSGFSGEYKFISAYNNRALENQYWSNSNGGNIAMYDYLGQTNQKWIVTPVGGGYYKIINKFSGKAMDVAGWSTANGWNIHQWSYVGGNNQKWRFEDSGNGTINIVSKLSGKCADIEDWNYGNNANVQQWTIGDGANQKWQLSRP